VCVSLCVCRQGAAASILHQTGPGETRVHTAGPRAALGKLANCRIRGNKVRTRGLGGSGYASWLPSCQPEWRGLGGVPSLLLGQVLAGGLRMTELPADCFLPFQNHVVELDLSENGYV
jgi:hypothetical protein